MTIELSNVAGKKQHVAAERWAVPGWFYYQKESWTFSGWLGYTYRWTQ